MLLLLLFISLNLRNLVNVLATSQWYPDGKHPATAIKKWVTAISLDPGNKFTH
jgi:hypothetical protein